MAKEIRITTHLMRVAGNHGQTACIVWQERGKRPEQFGLIAEDGLYAPHDLVKTLNDYIEHKQFGEVPVKVSPVTAALLAMAKIPQEYIGEFPKSLLRSK